MEVPKQQSTTRQRHVQKQDNNNKKSMGKRWVDVQQTKGRPPKPSLARFHMMVSSRYKTELCRQFEEEGICHFEDKCLFAHGTSELRPLPRHPKYKTELCRDYHEDGFCSFGPRCNFIHSRQLVISEPSQRDESTTTAFN